MALNAYLTLKGDTHGKIRGSSTKVGREDSIICIAFKHEVVSPRDAASGLPTGKRQHKPIVITKEIDKATPLLLRSLCENEFMSEWKLEFWRPSKSGSEEHYYTIELHDARVAGIRSEMEDNKYPENLKQPVREFITFTYGKIILTFVDGGISAEDDWESPAV